ncbi:DgyrCDS11218 [Dimorphilus gyrociliatus]|uniref:DgyrCDS11218 n=1 Tax=Dimorphilus gyrociliatus TaxID=2664684 RepID=A0A7I8W555_9ANNE|nr:DgyrCDS11218 [Dimorphilus gyrociliatus]
MDIVDDVDKAGDKIKQLLRELSSANDEYVKEKSLELTNDNDEEIRRLRERNNFFQNKNADLEEVVDKLKADLTKAEFERTSLQTEVNDLKRSIKIDSDTIKEIRHRNQSLQKENTSLEITLEEHSKKNNLLQEQLGSYQSKTRDAESKERRESRRVLDLERKLAQCIDEKNEIESIIQRQRNFEEEKERQIIKLEKSVKEKDDVIANLCRSNKELTEKMKASEEESFRLVETHKKRDSQKIGELEMKITDLENNLKRQSQEQSMALDKKRFEEDRAAFRYRIAEERKLMERERSRKEEYIGKFHDTKKELEDYQKQSQAKIILMEKNNDILKQEVENLRSQTLSAQTQLDDLRRRFNTVKKDADEKKLDTRAQIQSLKEDKQMLQSEINTLKNKESMLGDVRVELGIKTNRLKELEHQVIEYRRRSYQLEEENRQIVSEIDFERRKRQKTIEDQQKHTGELENLKWALKEQEKQITDLERINKVLEQDGKKAIIRIEEERNHLKQILDQKLTQEDEIFRRNKQLENDLESHKRKVKQLEESRVCTEEELQQTRQQFETILSSKLSLTEGKEKLTEQLFTTEQNLHEIEKERGSLLQSNEALEREVVNIKEESTKHRTKLAEAREIQIQLTEELRNLEVERNELRDEISSYEYELEKARQTFKTTVENEKFEKHKMEVTKRQQMNVIDLLQQQLDAPKKKKKKTELFSREEQLQKTLRVALDENARLSRDKVELEQKIRNLSRSVPQVTTVKTTNCFGTTEMSTPKTPKTPRCQNRSKQTSETPGAPRANTMGRPHRFVTGLNSRPDKCVLCLGNVEFVREATKCEECLSVCHPLCSPKMPPNCGMKTEYRRVFDDLFKEVTERKVRNVAKLKKVKSGWITIYRQRKNVWEKKWMVLKDNVVFIYNSDTVVEPYCEDIPLRDGKTLMRAAVNPVELPNVCLTDLPLVFSIRRNKTLYINPGSVTDKHHWVAYLDAIMLNEKSDTTIFSSLLVSQHPNYIHEACCINNSDCLMATDKGLHVHSDMLNSTLTAFGQVSAVRYISQLNTIVLVVGASRRVAITTYNDVLNITSNKKSSTNLPLAYLDDAVNCTTIEVGMYRRNVYLAVATAENLMLYGWSPKLDSFTLIRTLLIPKPAGCMMFSDDRLIVGSDKFYTLDLQSFKFREFLNEKDSTLAFAIFGASTFLSFPLSVVQISPNELLVCFSDFGIFVDPSGKRTREEDLNWPGEQPVMVAYSQPYLFLILSGSVQVLLIPNRGEPYVASGTIQIPSPVFVGKGVESGTVMITAEKNKGLDLLQIMADLEDNYDFAMDETDAKRENDVCLGNSRKSGGESIGLQKKQACVRQAKASSGGRMK